MKNIIDNCQFGCYNSVKAKYLIFYSLVPMSKNVGIAYNIFRFFALRPLSIEITVSFFKLYSHTKEVAKCQILKNFF